MLQNSKLQIFQNKTKRLNSTISKQFVIDLSLVLRMLVLFFLCGFVQRSWAASINYSLEDFSSEKESLGKLEVSDFGMAPNFKYSEPKSGSFALTNSYVTLNWSKADELKVFFTFGTKSLLGVPSRYGSVQSQEIGLIEAFGQYEDLNGKIRFGLAPIPFGLQSGVPESDLRLDRSLFFENRLGGLRDIGFYYKMSYLGISSEWMIHNGESGADLDNEIWFTGRWSYRSSRVWWGASAQIGRTSPESTNPNSNNLMTKTAMNLNQGSKIRLGSFFYSYRDQGFEANVELILGDIIQSNQQSHIVNSYVDFFVPFETKWTKRLAFLTRLDYLSFGDDIDPVQRKYSAGFCYKGIYENSDLYLVGSHIVNPGSQNDSHQVMVYWKLTPFANVRP